MRFTSSSVDPAGTLNHPEEIYLARSADLTATDEADPIRWGALDEAVPMIDAGVIIGAATVVGLCRAVLPRCFA